MHPRAQELLAYVGANVRRHRQKHGWTQQQLAEQVGVELNTVQRLEAGKHLSFEMLALVADALDVAPWALLRPAELPEVKRGRPKKPSAE